MSTHKSTKGKRGGAIVLPTDYPSLVRVADLLQLRSLAYSTRADVARQREEGAARNEVKGGRHGCPQCGQWRAQYLRYVRRLGVQAGADPARLSEEQVRAHILKLKTAHAYSPSSMRTAVAAFSAFFNLHLGNTWKLFGLVRSPDRKTLPTVLTREQLARLFAAVREERFRTLFHTIYACGLRVSEAVNLRVGDIEAGGTCLRVRDAKGGKDRLVPLPTYALQKLRTHWKTHRHPLLLFPGVGRGWRERPDALARRAQAADPLGVGSVQTCLRYARADARLPATTCVHTLRHSYATHLLEEGVSIRLISAYLGHASLETTLIYTHLTAVNEASARAALERLRPPPSPPPAPAA